MSLTFAALLQAAVVTTGAHTYTEAHHQVSDDSAKPLVVLVGADWCPACRAMKDSTMPAVERRGLLRKVAFALVNTDRESNLAQKLMVGGSIPQLIVYRKTPTGWNRQILMGAQSEEAIQTAIESAVKQQELASKEKPKTIESPKATESAKVAAKPKATESVNVTAKPKPTESAKAIAKPKGIDTAKTIKEASQTAKVPVNSLGQR